MRDHHRFLLQSLLRQLYFIETEIELLDTRLEQLGQQRRRLAEALNRWVTVPGVDRWRLEFHRRDGSDVSQLRTSALLAGQACVPATRRVQASGSAARSVKAVPGCVVWPVNPDGWSSHEDPISQLSLRSLLLVEEKCAIIAVAHGILVVGYRLQRERCAYTVWAVATSNDSRGRLETILGQALGGLGPQ